jgi:hypothetical protein
MVQASAERAAEAGSGPGLWCRVVVVAPVFPRGFQEEIALVQMTRSVLLIADSWGAERWLVEGTWVVARLAVKV